MYVGRVGPCPGPREWPVYVRRPRPFARPRRARRPAPRELVLRHQPRRLVEHEGVALEQGSVVDRRRVPRRLRELHHVRQGAGVVVQRRRLRVDREPRELRLVGRPGSTPPQSRPGRRRE